MTKHIKQFFNTETAAAFLNNASNAVRFGLQIYCGLFLFLSFYLLSQDPSVSMDQLAETVDFPFGLVRSIFCITAILVIANAGMHYLSNSGSTSIVVSILGYIAGHIGSSIVFLIHANGLLSFDSNSLLQFILHHAIIYCFLRFGRSLIMEYTHWGNLDHGDGDD